MEKTKEIVARTATNIASGYQFNRQEIETLDEAYMLADSVLMKKYLVNMRECEIVPVEDTQLQDIPSLFKITRLIYDKEENNQEKLLNVYNALYACGGSVILLLKSDKKKVDVYLGTKAPSSNAATTCQQILEKTIKGNFCGTILEDFQKDDDVKTFMERVTQESNGKYVGAVATVTSMAGFRDGHTMKSGDFVQGLEKLADAMRGEYYTLMIVADPILPEALEARRSGYEELYNRLSPFAALEMTYGQNFSEAVAKSITHGTSKAITDSIAKMTSHTYGTTQSHSDTKGTTNSIGVFAGISVPGFMVGGGTSYNRSSSQSFTDTKGTTSSDTKGTTKSSGKTSSVSDSFGATDTHTTGESINYTKHLEKRDVKALLERIDTQLARIDECMDVGMWDCAAYVISDNQQDSQMVASTYQALIRGKESGTESAAITVWDDEKSEQVVNYLRIMRHPLIRLTDSVTVTPTTVLSGEELTVAAGLPQQSLAGLAVDTYARFGREIVCLRHYSVGKEQQLALGKIYHMGKEEESLAYLDMDALTAHTFVTGSTGSGKSNTVYKILEGLQKKKIHWLVIEPAKGEYKDVFGGIANVYGTNPFKSPNLLHVNPFVFPADKGIHVLEHIDRLAEIFNACWPMYAAMPAILRESMERAYEECGWNLKMSKNPGMFPTFETLLEILPQVIDSSAYSADTTNDYKGALVTRVRSLTRGIHGLIFSEDTDAKELFDNNAIVDLSRVGSRETKSLIMGILVLKLQEYRMANAEEPNSALRHVSVLEEAHHLLRRTSNEQSQESANLTGQAVAMLANSIAEMRTYGEGFIIADQSPGLMDMSVVRNTNTKIILRLPDEGDRELVGRAAGLNDAQIEELAFLERGVAAIYQSDWAEAVLTKVDKLESSNPMKQESYEWQDEETELVKKFFNMVLEIERIDFSLEEVVRLRKWYKGLLIRKDAERSFELAFGGKILNDEAKVTIILNVIGKRASGMTLQKEVMEQAKYIFSGRYDMQEDSATMNAIQDLLAKYISDNVN